MLGKLSAPAVNVGHPQIVDWSQAVTLLETVRPQLVRWMNALRPYSYGGERLLTPDDDWQFRGGPWSQWNGHVPPEICVQTANRLKVRSYVNWPYNVSAAEIQRLTAVMATHDRDYYVTIGNEPWNDVFTAQYARLQQIGGGIDLSAALRGYAARIRQLHAADPHGRIVIEGHTRRPETARYLLEDCGLGQIVDALAIAPYVGRRNLTGHESAEWLAADFKADLFGPLPGQLTAAQGIVAHAELAARYKLELVGYEAGHHYRGQSAELAAMIADGRMWRLYQQLRDFWRGAANGPLIWYRLWDATPGPGQARTEHWGLFDVAAGIARPHLLV